MEVFCIVKNVFTVFFDQFNASLLKKSIVFFKKWSLYICVCVIFTFDN